MIALLLSAMAYPASAEDPKPNPVSKKNSAVELNEMEITGSLRDIVGSFKLKEVEIMGSFVGPKMDLLPWKDPMPFPETEVDLTRELIAPYYDPLDREKYIQHYDIATQLPANSEIEQTKVGLFSAMPFSSR
jgi:hypothetical protein